MNTNDLLADVKRKSFLPFDQATLSDSDILDMATKEMTTVIMPKIMSLRSGYFSVMTEVVITASRRYRMPPRAMGNKLYDITVFDSGMEFSLNQVHPYDIQRREGFYIEGADIVLTPQTRTQGIMRIRYPCRPLKLIGNIPSVVTGIFENTVTSAVADGFTYDIQQATAPYGIIVPDAQFVSGVYTKLTDQNVQLGDLLPVTTEGHFTIPLPEEMTDWLCQRTTMRALEYLGHQDHMALAGAKLADMERDIMALFSPRVDGEEKVFNDKETLGWRTW